MATASPLLLSEQFTVGAGNNFGILVSSFRDAIRKFGTPAQEILSGAVIPLLAPSNGRSEFRWL